MTVTKTQIAAGETYVATDDDGVFQGFIVFYAEDGHTMLENVAVLPRAAGRGVGKMLIGFCENAARHERASLYQREDDRESLDVSRLGYVEVGRRTENGFKRVYFEKTLT